MINPDTNKEFTEKELLEVMMEDVGRKLYNIEYFLKPSPEDSSGMSDTLHDKLTDIDNRIFDIVDTLSSVKKFKRLLVLTVFLLSGILLVLLLK